MQTLLRLVLAGTMIAITAAGCAHSRAGRYTGESVSPSASPNTNAVNSPKADWPATPD